MAERTRGGSVWRGLFAKRGAAPRRRRRADSSWEALESRVLLTTPPAFPPPVDSSFDASRDVIEMGDDGRWWVGRSDTSDAGKFVTSIWADWADASNFKHVDTGDFNRDGDDDILGIDRWGNVWVGLSNGSNAFTTTLWATGFTDDLVHVAVSDVDADLFSDLVAFTADGSWQVALSNQADGLEPTTQWADWADASNFAHIAVSDFDGDGAEDDVAGMDLSGNWWVATGNETIPDYFPLPGNGTAFVGTSLWANWADASAFAKIETADFNGDGATDIAGFDHSGNWWVATSNFLLNIPPSSTAGTAFVGTSLWADWADASNFVKVGVGDFNGDGATDVAGLDLAGNWWAGTSNFNPNGPVFGTQFVNTSLWASWGDVSNLREVDLLDFDGSATDVAGFDADGRWRVGLSDHGTLIDHPASRFVDNRFWADWDPTDTFATVNGDLAIKRQVNDLMFV